MTIMDLSDTEYDTLCEMTSHALDVFFAGKGWRTAHRNVLRWCARRGIPEEDLWDWLND